MKKLLAGFGGDHVFTGWKCSCGVDLQCELTHTVTSVLSWDETTPFQDQIREVSDDLSEILRKLLFEPNSITGAEIVCLVNYMEACRDFTLSCLSVGMKGSRGKKRETLAKGHPAPVKP